MSTFALLTDLTTDSSLNVTLSPERFLRRRLNRSECAECLNVCPSEALSLIDNQVCHDLRECTSCMMCTALCPNDAFVVNGYHLETRIQTLAPREDLLVSCSRQTQIHPDELVVPCVGALSMAHLLALCLKPAGKIVFNVSACDSCENKAAADHLESQVTFLKENHPDIISAELITLKTATEPISALVSQNRRSFLMGMKNSFVSAVESQLPTFQHNPTDNESRNRRVPIKVKLVKNLLKQLDQKKKDFVSSLCLYEIRVTDKCSVCPLCKGICPTGAIKIEKIEKEKTLVIDNTLCSGCGLCVTFCKNDALRLQRPEGLDIKI